MKKVSLLGLFLLASTTQFASADVVVAEGPVAAAPAGAVPAAGCPKAFQGFHLGGNIGFGIATGRHRFLQDAASDSFRTKMGAIGVDGGVGVGYTHRLCNWALGIAFDANWTNVKGSHNFEGFAFKTRLRNTLQLYGRLGYVLRDIAMPFIGLGWDNSQWKHSTTFTDAAGEVFNVGHKSRRVNSFMWKLGVDFLATKHVVVGFEYTGNAGGKVSHRGNEGFDDASGRFKPQYNKFALTAKIVY